MAGDKVMKSLLNRIKAKLKPARRAGGVLKSPKEYSEILRSLEGKYRGERCFVLGNGPSLNKCDLTLLSNEYSFAVNGIFYKTQEMGYKPNFYMVEDNHVVSDNLVEINRYECAYKFFPANYRDKIDADSTTIFLPADLGFYRNHHPSFCVPRFSKDLSLEIFAGQSVTIMQLQLAYHLGFSEVFLIGMDFSYDVPDSTVIEGVNYTSQEDDVNHFHPSYFGKGKKWHDPKLDRVLKSYEKCKSEFEADGRKIYNATVGGKLELFERTDFKSLF
jgi:hypothetical protein